MTNTATFTWLTGSNINGTRQGVEESADGKVRMYVRQADGTMSFGRWSKPRGRAASLDVRVAEMARW